MFGSVNIPLLYLISIACLLHVMYAFAIVHVLQFNGPHVLMFNKDIYHITLREAHLHVASAFTTLASFVIGWRRVVIVFCTIRSITFYVFVTAARVTPDLLVI